MPGETYCIEKVKELLPYRYPMLLVDRFLIESENKFVGLKNLSFNEEVFQGHFPGHPIFPGVLHVEAMEQAAELAVGRRLDPEGGNDVYIKALKRVKFRKPAFPGDRLKICIEVKSFSGNEAEIYAENHISSGLACQANLTLSVRPRLEQAEMPKLFTGFDRNSSTAMDVTKIMAVIPHRYPFLLVDYIAAVKGSHVTAVKNVTADEPFMHSHSPGYAVLPGAVQAEIVAQAGCVLTLMKPENKGKLAYFMAIDQSDFHLPVRPGDQLRIEVDVPEGSSRFGRGEGCILVEDKVVSRTVMTFAVMDNKN